MTEGVLSVGETIVDHYPVGDNDTDSGDKVMRDMRDKSRRWETSSL